MKKFNRLIRGLALFAISSSLLVQCSKDEGGDNYATPTPNEEVTLSASDFSSSIDENPSQGAALGRVQATASSGTPNFSIVSQSIAGAITVSSNSGDLTVANPSLFDFETRQNYRYSAGKCW